MRKKRARPRRQAPEVRAIWSWHHLVVTNMTGAVMSSTRSALPLKKDWIAVHHPSGIYYYHAKSRMTTRDPPRIVVPSPSGSTISPMHEDSVVQRGTTRTDYCFACRISIHATVRYKQASAFAYWHDSNKHPLAWLEKKCCPHCDKELDYEAVPARGVTSSTRAA